MSESKSAAARPTFQARGRFIWSGPSEHDVKLGEVYDKGPGSIDAEEMAKVWAASYCTMFPALANIRNVARRAVETDRYETEAGLYALLAGIAKAAGDALPVPTIGDLSGTSPATPSPSSPVPAELPAAVAASLAQMVIEWVEGGIKSGEDWKSGLAPIIDKRLHRLLSLPASGGAWLPIETAPKDGTRVLLANGEFVGIARWLSDYQCRANAPMGGWVDDLNNGGPEDHDWPTRWQPLPAPPSATSDAEG
jgi:hypothetical protein